jgi:hypothetical protein
MLSIQTLLPLCAGVPANYPVAPRCLRYRLLLTRRQDCNFPQMVYNAGMSLTALSPTVLSTDVAVNSFPMSSELTVEQAARFLKTSERHLNALLDAGRVAFRLENSARLVQSDSLLEFEQWRQRGHEALDRMMRWNQEMGLYDD